MQIARLLEIRQEIRPSVFVGIGYGRLLITDLAGVFQDI